MSRSPELVTVRHAPVTARWSGRCYGAIDVDVEPAAPEAAARVLPLLAGTPTRIWTSPLLRCREVAERVGIELGVPVEVDGSLTELDHGTFEGRTWDAIHAEEPEALARWGERWRDEGPPGGESARSLEARVRAWHDDLDGPSATHLLVAHAGVVRALAVVRNGVPWETALRREVPHLVPVSP